MGGLCKHVLVGIEVGKHLRSGKIAGGHGAKNVLEYVDGFTVPVGGSQRIGFLMIQREKN